MDTSDLKWENMYELKSSIFNIKITGKPPPLRKVYKVFKDSPFHVTGESSVSIMDGLDEGIFAWVTVNFLIGKFNHGVESLVGALDLGGGSTQITFYPKSEDTIANSPKDFTQKAKVFDQEYKLYTHR
ncbi:ectonucleoside triphosphate diphosphohydrolase 5-like [Actinia tenebrosa]|uniref:Ectonucleoside triphosphate diphosphohydrolase 5-like n=1 Tax=Actinia tenebrosa TaxID=6105 RepID=A0A6P8I1T5_ACTTE|nr:ectonucleoside triphosphate diphosphohydrolase 5-like [Actinia tenebrosa]